MLLPWTRNCGWCSPTMVPAGLVSVGGWLGSLGLSPVGQRDEHQLGLETSQLYTIDLSPLAPVFPHLAAFPPLVSQPTPDFSSSASLGKPGC